MIKIIPSIASANLLCVGDEIKKAEKHGAVHLDIEDGNFSPDITFGMGLVEQLAKVTSCEMDAHLMVTDPLKYVEPLMKCKVRKIAIHLESTKYPSQCIELIHRRRGKAGIALNYKTRADDVIPYATMIDYVLLQTGEAGDPRLAFKPYTYAKIRQLKRILEGTSAEIWTDGGIKMEMLQELEELGVDAAIMGRAVFSAGEV